MRELHRIGVRPLDSDIHKNCVREILDRLAAFDEDKMANRQPSMQKCSLCSRSWKPIVQYARRQVESYFDGLCLDCMKNHPDEDSEYWALGTRRVYDLTCRISHGEPTWYFSFMGRRDRSPYRMQHEWIRRNESRIHGNTGHLPWCFAEQSTSISFLSMRYPRFIECRNYVHDKIWSFSQ